MVAETRTAPDTSAIDAFAEGLRGSLLQPDDAGYDEARMVRNGLIDRRPGMIVQCSGTADVVDAVNFARVHDLLLSIRGGGHNVAGNAVNDGGMVVDLSGMRGVHVDPEKRTARAQGGATWADLDRETQLFGLATTGGQISSTGIAGLTLHGGFGSLMRSCGLALDNLRSVQIVTADGQVRTASERENPDLFWAVRGAGSNFGVVTSFEFTLHRVGPEITAATPIYALADAPVVLKAYNEYIQSVPDEVSSQALFWSIPPDPDLPASLHGTPVLVLDAMYSGDPDEGEPLIRPIREFASPLLDLSGRMPYTARQSGFDHFFPKGWLYYWKSSYLNDLTAEAMHAIIELAANRPTPKTLINVWHLGGAIRQTPSDATAFGERDAPFLLSLETTWSDPADTDRCIAWTRDAWTSMQRFGPGGLYLNVAGFGEEKEALVRSAYGDNYDRLVELKTQYDPNNLFRMNQNIKPEAMELAAD